MESDEMMAYHWSADARADLAAFGMCLHHSPPPATHCFYAFRADGVLMHRADTREECAFWAKRFARMPDVLGVVISDRGAEKAPLKRSVMAHYETFDIDGARIQVCDVPTRWKPEPDRRK